MDVQKWKMFGLIALTFLIVSAPIVAASSMSWLINPDTNRRDYFRVYNASDFVANESDPVFMLANGSVACSPDYYFTNLSLNASGLSGICTQVALTPAGSDTQIQFNDGGEFNGSAGLTWNGSALYLTSNTTLTTNEATVLVKQHDTTGTVNAGFGVKEVTYLKGRANTLIPASEIETSWYTTPAAGFEGSELELSAYTRGNKVTGISLKGSGPSFVQVSIGQSNTLSGFSPIVIGSSNTATVSDKAVVIGGLNTATKDGCVVIGARGTCAGTSAMAISTSYAYAQATNAVAIGYWLNSNALNAVTIGSGATGGGGPHLLNSEAYSILMGHRNEEWMFLKQNETAFNTDSTTRDFRVETDNETQALFLNGTTGDIFLNGKTTITAPFSTLNVVGTIESTSLAGTYGSGSAHVCVYDNGTLFASDAACA